jgi:alkylhydroperoxidase family enzyme
MISATKTVAPHQEEIMTQSRIAPLEPPYDSDTQKLFDLAMPEGMEPLVLFRTLATCGRVFPRFMRGGVLDRGPIEIRDREIVIHRTTARCGAEYEWGVHVNAFARPLGMSEKTIRATVTAGPADPVWTPRQAILIRLCDELHDTATVSEGLWEDLRAEFEPDQIIELIYTVGLYHVVSFLANGLALEPESFGERFPEDEGGPPEQRDLQMSSKPG